jgi:lipopolysaccharide/colanic/teichoic acid biosynthesis glycosyltransferase
MHTTRASLSKRERHSSTFYTRILKRVFDVAFSLPALVVLSPLMLIIAIMVKVSSPGPILFRQKRVGLQGKEFVFYKFRSMYTKPEKPTYETTAQDDPRIIPNCKILRKTHLDELPQLWNVLWGDMSLVGPRPMPLVEMNNLASIYSDLPKRSGARPGITGLAQVKSGYECTKEKVDLDLKYLETCSLKNDIRILLDTIPVVIKRQGR